MIGHDCLFDYNVPALVLFVEHKYLFQVVMREIHIFCANRFPPRPATSTSSRFPDSLLAFPSRMSGWYDGAFGS